MKSTKSPTCRTKFSALKPLNSEWLDSKSFSSSRPILYGKTAIVTGSTSGIGLGIATALAHQGCKVVLNGFGNQQQILANAKKMASDFTTEVEYHPADLSKPSEIASMFSLVTEKFGGVDILVNNAGIQHVSPIDTFPDNKWNEIIAINLSAVFHTTKLALPMMKAKKWGRIVNISSVHGLVASANKAPYVASKHAVVGMTKAVALETAGSGITVNCINPGWVHTALVEEQILAKAKQLGVTNSTATEQLLSEKQPSKMFVKVDDIAAAVLFLCTPSANQITGISLPIDGGWTAQ